MQILLAIIFLIVMLFIADKKGFNPWLWLLPSGPLGLIILLCMPSANAVGIDEETSEQRKRSGNSTGGVLSVIVAVLLAFLFVVLSTI